MYLYAGSGSGSTCLGTSRVIQGCLQWAGYFWRAMACESLEAYRSCTILRTMFLAIQKVDRERVELLCMQPCFVIGSQQ